MKSINKANATINEVAAKAKVSKTTISRYLNGKYEYMSAETKERIEKVIEELNYRPSNIARSLKAKNSNVIGCIIADIGSPFSSIVVKGINDVCNKAGYRVLFANTDNNPENEIKSIQSLMDNKVDGLIINTSGENDKYLLELRKNGLNIVLADRCLVPGNLIDTVATDNHNATYNCIEFLNKQGYKKIGFFTQNMSSNSSRYLRHQGYKDALKDFYKMDGNKYTYIVESNDEDKCDKEVMKFLKNCKGEAGAIFTVNGVTLLNVLNSMNRLNIKIAEDLGVCGFDDWGWASLIPPGITTITQESYECGVQAANMLIKLMKSTKVSEAEYLELPAKLMVRGSTNLENRKQERS